MRANHSLLKLYSGKLYEIFINCKPQYLLIFLINFFFVNAQNSILDFGSTLTRSKLPQDAKIGFCEAWSLDRKMNTCNRFPVSKNHSLVYHYAYICDIWEFLIFCQIFPRSEKGVAKNNFCPPI